MSKYQHWHDQIIDRARNRVLDPYLERHHIKPRAFGGSDDPSNLVDLTYREHFLIHWLLRKLVIGHERRQMLYALHCMTMAVQGRPPIAGWQIEIAKRALKREAMKRVAARRVARKAALKDKRLQLIAAAQDAQRKAPDLRDFRKAETRSALRTMAADFLAGHPNKVRLLGLRKRRKKAKW